MHIHSFLERQIFVHFFHFLDRENSLIPALHSYGGDLLRRLILCCLVDLATIIAEIFRYNLREYAPGRSWYRRHGLLANDLVDTLSFLPFLFVAPQLELFEGSGSR